jgi:hypothetical protein
MAMMAMARSRFMARSLPVCSVFLPRDCPIFPIRSGGQIVQSPARAPVPHGIGIGGAGRRVKWLMRGGMEQG